MVRLNTVVAVLIAVGGDFVDLSVSRHFDHGRNVRIGLVGVQGDFHSKLSQDTIPNRPVTDVGILYILG